jgi:hypothetical protein
MENISKSLPYIKTQITMLECRVENYLKEASVNDGVVTLLSNQCGELLEKKHAFGKKS